MNNELLIAQNITASGSTYSAVATPTFPYSGPFEMSSTTSTSTQTATLTLTSDNSSPEVGDTFKVSVNVNSGSNSIKSYKISLTFDPSIANVIDTDSSKSGTQVTITDTFFTNKANSVDNTNGTITIEASASSASTVNRRVADISFRGLSSGNLVISKNSTDTILISGSDTNVSLNYTALTIQIGTQQNTETTTSSDVNSETTTTDETNATTSLDTVPSTAISTNEVSLFVTLATASLLVLLGFSATIRQRKKKLEKDLI